MAQKPETRFRDSIHKHLPAAAPGVFHHEKMNNPFFSGTADDWYSGRKGDLWVEYKYIEVARKRDTTNIPLASDLLSARQLLWLNGRHDEGRNVHVIVGCEDGGVLFSDQSWNTDLSVGQFRQLRIYSRKELAAWIMQQTMEALHADRTGIVSRQ